VEGDRRSGRGHHLTADRQNAVHLPHAFFEVVTLDRGHRRQQQVADRVPAQAGLAVAGESVLEQLAHQRLRIRQGHDAVADVAHRRNAQLLAQPARRSAVVGDRDHGRDIAGVLLDPAQQRGQAGSAADDDDLRAARQEALLVDDLDEWLIALGGEERPHQDADGAPRAIEEKTRADRPDDQAAPQIGQELQRDQVEEALARAGEVVVAIELSEEQRAGKSQQQLAGEHHQQPALQSNARHQPAPQDRAADAKRRPAHSRSSSRWKTATAPKPWLSSHFRSSSVMTIDRW
jgi:hypothetical protein